MYRFMAILQTTIGALLLVAALVTLFTRVVPNVLAMRTDSDGHALGQVVGGLLVAIALAVVGRRAYRDGRAKLAGGRPVSSGPPGMRARTGSRSPAVTEEVLSDFHASNIEVLRALAEAGGDLSRPHEIEHHFLCPDRKAAEPILAWGRSAGYRPSAVFDAEHEGLRYVHFDLVMATVPTLANMTAQTTSMLEIAARCGVDYDGWGCSVERS